MTFDTSPLTTRHAFEEESVDSEKVNRLMNALVDQKQLPTSTEQVIKEFGGQGVANELVSRLVREKMAGGFYFAKAIALAKYSELPEDVKEWFVARKMTLLPNENIVVHLKHDKENDFGASGCHEVGFYITKGVPGVLRDYEMVKAPTVVAQNAFTAHDINNANPRGSWASVNIWERLHFAVANSYIAGGVKMQEGF